MSNSEKGDFYFGISEDKIFICFFEKENSTFKSSINFDIPEGLDNDLNFKVITNLLKENIKKIEKKLGFFLNSANISIKSKTYQTVLLSIKNIFDNKNFNKEIISNMVQSAVRQFYADNKNLNIIHILINKYIIDDKIYNIYPHNIKCKKVILEIEFICLDKVLINKIKNLLKKCDIHVDRIISFEYSQKFFNDTTDVSMCITARKIAAGVNQSEVYFTEELTKKTSIFDKIFNFFD